MKIGILTGSVREGRNNEAVTNWVLDYANSRNDEGVQYGIIDINDFDLPILGVNPTEAQGNDIKRFSETVAGYDGFIFVTPEYNRQTSGAMKNALDYLQPELHNKAVGYVSYGGLGGVSAIQGLRLIAAEQEMADVRTMVNFSLMADFENMSVFKPNDYHVANAEKMIDQVLLWTKGLSTIR